VDLLNLWVQLILVYQHVVVSYDVLRRKRPTTEQTRRGRKKQKSCNKDISRIHCNLKIETRFPFRQISKIRVFEENGEEDGPKKCVIMKTVTMNVVAFVILIILMNSLNSLVLEFNVKGRANCGGYHEDCVKDWST